ILKIDWYSKLYIQTPPATIESIAGFADFREVASRLRGCVSLVREAVTTRYPLAGPTLKYRESFYLNSGCCTGQCWKGTFCWTLVEDGLLSREITLVVQPAGQFNVIENAD